MNEKKQGRRSQLKGQKDFDKFEELRHLNKGKKFIDFKTKSKMLEYWALTQEIKERVKSNVQIPDFQSIRNSEQQQKYDDDAYDDDSPEYNQKRKINPRCGLKAAISKDSDSNSANPQSNEPALSRKSKRSMINCSNLPKFNLQEIETLDQFINFEDESSSNINNPGKNHPVYEVGFRLRDFLFNF
jgi:hypothetical protein